MVKSRKAFIIYRLKHFKLKFNKSSANRMKMLWPLLFPGCKVQTILHFWYQYSEYILTFDLLSKCQVDAHLSVLSQYYYQK